uniref:E2F/DP family winged-helix DNA-binding domain-containing protein n=1 Tax=Salix viminalis TaxID=40686 RepID=A0A6N2KWI1_SALVM
MVTGGAHLEDGDRHPSSASRRGGGGATTGSWASGQSVSTSGSVGSPSSRSEQAMATPASDNTFLRLNHLDIHADDAATQDAAGNKKKKRGQRAVGADKSGRGLRQFSIKVCEKVESKGTTTYNEVADELVAEFADPINSVSTPDQQQYDEKNIRRRVYDALNVLMALDIISKDKKEIQWKGLPRTSLSDIEELKAERLGLRNRIEKKAAYLQELEEQNLIQRNEQLYSSENAPSGGVSLPFILVQTRPHATVEVEISEDMQLVHFDFNSTPFELHDDNYVLKAMKFCERPQSDDMASNPAADGGEGSSMSNMYQPQILTSPRTNTPVRPPTSPPLPGIIKARVKNEH